MKLKELIKRLQALQDADPQCEPEVMLFTNGELMDFDLNCDNLTIILDPITQI